MRKTAQLSSGSAKDVVDGLSLAELEHRAANWCLDGEVRQLSKGTIYNRRMVTGKLIWFLRHHELERCGPMELRRFFAYLANAHETPSGRWGSDRRRKPLRPAAVKLYYARLQTFGNFLVEEGVLDVSPMARLKPPIVRQDQVQPFTRDQQEALRAAARKSRHPRRDDALVLFMLDTGARASEVCGLRVRDVRPRSRPTPEPQVSRFRQCAGHSVSGAPPDVPKAAPLAPIPAGPSSSWSTSSPLKNRALQADNTAERRA